jgi:hypothetical protein
MASTEVDASQFQSGGRGFLRGDVRAGDSLFAFTLGASHGSDGQISILGERLHWGYPRGAFGWQQASGERNHSSHARRTGENCKVKRRYVE